MKKNTNGFTLTKARRTEWGFTLIELLVVISILGVLLALSVFGLQGARQSSRDGKRQTDIEQIRSGIEIYRADCDGYPTSLPAPGGSLVGNCPTANVYISSMPADPVPSNHSYLYYSNGSTYEICASLEQGGTTVTCGGSSNCGGSTCNYKKISP